MERRLVTLRVVRELEPIEGADRIEIAHVDGWQCIVKKGEFNVGQEGLYFEIDSFLPASDERFSFLKNSRLFEGVKGFRIKTMKMRGALSQGLLLPLKDFPDVLSSDSVDGDYAPCLGVKKWERPLPSCLRGYARGNFPDFLPKTDQERAQNIDEKYFEIYSLDDFEITEKYDGSSMTAYLNNDVFGVCSRNLDLKESEENAFWQAARKYDLETILREENRNLAFQGELTAPNVQNNPHQVEELHFHIFDVYDIDAQRYLTPMERHLLLKKYPAILHVPFVSIPELDTIEFTRKGLIEYFDGFKWSGCPAPQGEGVVFKHKTEKFSFKVINNSYLLKEAD